MDRLEVTVGVLPSASSGTVCSSSAASVISSFPISSGTYPDCPNSLACCCGETSISAIAVSLGRLSGLPVSLGVVTIVTPSRKS